MISTVEPNSIQDLPSSGRLAVCGISHKSASLAEREPFQVGRADLVPAVKLFKSIDGVREVVFVATCNRLEAYMVLDEGVEPFVVLCEFFRRKKGIEAADRRKIFYVRHASTVARHLFRVVAGLDSLVLGEYQIQNQMKEAYSTSCSAKGAGKILHRLFHAAFRAGKTVRSRTAIGVGQHSVAGVAMRLLKERLDRKDTVLIVGVNESTRIVADGLRAAGFDRLIFANRTASKAEKMASRFGGEWFGLDDLPGLLSRSQGVVSSTGAQGFVIGARLFESLLDGGSSIPGVIVDMAVPRDVELPSVAAGKTSLFDLEDLKGYLDLQENGRKAELPAAEGLIENVVSTFQIWMENAFDPGVAQLAKEYERVRVKCLDDAMGHFPPENRAELERFSRRLMQKLLNVPAGSIMESADPDAETGCRAKRATGTLRRFALRGGAAQGRRALRESADA